MLTASRSGEVRNARWEEVDRAEAVWTVPGERMKANREHRVPLSPRALEVLDEAAALFDSSGLLFPSPTGRVLNHATMTKLLGARAPTGRAAQTASDSSEPFRSAERGS